MDYPWLWYDFAMALLCLYHQYYLVVKGREDRWIAVDQVGMLPGGMALVTHRVAVSKEDEEWSLCGSFGMKALQ